MLLYLNDFLQIYHMSCIIRFDIASWICYGKITSLEYNFVKNAEKNLYRTGMLYNFSYKLNQLSYNFVGIFW